MSFEQKINYQLNKIPKVKKIIKRVYQRMMYFVSKKIKSEGNIIRISPDDSSHEYFFGYYDKSPWDINDRFMLCLRAKDTWSEVSPKEQADIILIDTSLPYNDKNRVSKIAETSSWNVQQSCMLQWLGPDFSSQILFNDFREGQYVTVIKEIASGNERLIYAPVYTVSSDGKIALTLDFSRLYNLRPGYGYYNVEEKTKGEALPDATAVWYINLESGDIKSLFTYNDFARFQPRKEMLEKGAVHKVNHLMISPNGKRCMVLYRWFNGQRKYTRLITFNVDGTDMFVLSDDDMVSHCYWKDDNHILAFENKKEGGPGYYLMTDKTNEYYHCWPQLNNDGHPSYSPDGRFIVTDTYPNRERIAEIKIMDGKNENNNSINVIARVFAPFKYDNDTRCDLHPRWNHKSDKVCFDSVFEGHRGLYTVGIDKNHSIVSDSNELISVVIPVYNTENYLKRCVDSVINQSYPNIEIILVNDGSTDNSLKLCEEYNRQYSNIVLVNKKNGGLSSARNAGIMASTGEYIAFLDSDDWVSLDCYEYMYNLIKQNDSEVVDIMVYQAKNEKDIPVSQSKEKVDTYTGISILENYMYRGMSEQRGAPYSACRKLYKKSLFSGDTKGFEEGIVNEDICFNFRILRKCKKIVVSNQVKYYYYQGEASITNGQLAKKDLALIDVSNDLMHLSQETNNKTIINLAKMKKARSSFSLLARAAKYGISQSLEEPDELVKEFLFDLKNNAMLLLKSPMSFSRKILVIAFIADYHLCCSIIKKLKI